MRRLSPWADGAPLGETPMQESKLIEELLVGDLGSDDAKKFLDQVPTLENMIPLPNGGASRIAIEEAQDI